MGRFLCHGFIRCILKTTTIDNGYNSYCLGLNWDLHFMSMMITILDRYLIFIHQFSHELLAISVPLWSINTSFFQTYSWHANDTWSSTRMKIVLLAAELKHGVVLLCSVMLWYSTGHAQVPLTCAHSHSIWEHTIGMKVITVRAFASHALAFYAVEFHLNARK